MAYIPNYNYFYIIFYILNIASLLIFMINIYKYLSRRNNIHVFNLLYYFKRVDISFLNI